MLVWARARIPSRARQQASNGAASLDAHLDLGASEDSVPWDRRSERLQVTSQDSRTRRALNAALSQSHLQLAQAERRHLEQQPSMAKSANLRFAIRASAIANRQIDYS